MRLLETPLAGVWILEPTRLVDERGHFARTFCAQTFVAHGLNPAIDQCSVSWNVRAGTLRGLHYQAAPAAEDKLVRVTRGGVYDVALDLRPGSRTHGCWFGVELDADGGRALYVPQGCAHGFITLCDATEVSYQISVPYRPELARGVRWNDPAFAIRWPREPAVISGRDRDYPDYRP